VNFRKTLALVVFLPQILIATATVADELVVKDNDSIVFLGDSITFWGHVQASGFCQLVLSAFKANGLTVTSFNAGVRGQNSGGMLQNVAPQVLARNPTFMTLSCGINDVLGNCPLDRYKADMTSIVDQAQAAGIKVMLLTATMIGEDVNNEKNLKLAPFNDFVRQLAKDKKCLLADVSIDLLAAIKPAHGGRPQAPGQLTWDGVHMNPYGNHLLAITVLKAFGMNEGQLKKAEEFWLHIQEYSACTVASTGLPVTMRQYQQLYDAAARENCTVDDWVRMQLIKRIQAPVSTSPGAVVHSETKPTTAVTGNPGATGLVVKDNDSIAFLGDAITLEGNRNAGGFVRLVISGLKGNGLTAISYPAGVRDDSSKRMLDRLVPDALSHKPTLMALSPGNFDLRANLPLDQFKSNVTTIIDQAQAAGVKVMILTAAMKGELAESDDNVRLAPFNDFLRQLAKEKKCLLADVNADMRASIQPGKDGKPQLQGQLFWNDGDMIPFGHQLVAACVLKAFGANESQLKKARDYWLSLPDADACTINAWGMACTIRQYHDMHELATQADCTVDEWIKQQLVKVILPSLVSAGK